MSTTISSFCTRSSFASGGYCPRQPLSSGLETSRTQVVLDDNGFWCPGEGDLAGPRIAGRGQQHRPWYVKVPSAPDTGNADGPSVPSSAARGHDLRPLRRRRLPQHPRALTTPADLRRGAIRRGFTHPHRLIEVWRHEALPCTDGTAVGLAHGVASATGGRSLALANSMASR